jgi:UDP-3-O-[3-hydroxymyristoyl] glucosamine N-acyltransferase
MQLSVAEIAKLLNGDVIGDESAMLNTVAKIEEGKPGALSFLANPKYESYLYETQSTAVLVNKDFIPSQPVSATLIKVDNAYAAFTALLEKFAGAVNKKSGISPHAFVSPTAKLADGVYIAPGAFIGEYAEIHKGAKIFPGVSVGDRSVVGENTILFSGVQVYHDIQIGSNCIIHSGTVVGSDGFGFAPQPDKSYKKIPQTGNVIIEDDVEIGANCAIDRATMGSTIIRKGVKLDNLVQIAHNVEIGEHTVIASQTGVAGSTKIGKYCIIAGQVGFVGHITIADGSVFGAQSGISNSIKEPNQKWFGYPAMDYGKALRVYSTMKSLPELEKRVRELEKQLKDLNNNNA